MHFAIRIGFYILFDFLILYHYKNQTLTAIKNLTSSVKPKFKKKYWTFLFLPILALILEFVPVIPKVVWELIAKTENMIS